MHILKGEQQSVSQPQHYFFTYTSIFISSREGIRSTKQSQKLNDTLILSEMSLKTVILSEQFLFDVLVQFIFTAQSLSEDILHLLTDMTALH